jgi:predicted DNA binding CopG/RHH family protein
MNLTPDEKSLLDSVERGEWKRIPEFEHEALRYTDAARTTLRMDKRVNITLTKNGSPPRGKAAVFVCLC